MHFYARIQMRVNILLKLGDEPMYLKRLKDLREDFDKKQHEIAEFLNITRQQYSLYELGKRDIPAEFIRKLAKYYNTSADYILEITDEITPYINSNTIKKDIPKK